MLKLIIIITLLFLTYGLYRYTYSQRQKLRKRRNEILYRLKNRE